MFPSRHPKPRKLRFTPWLELLEKCEVLDAALRFSTQQITVFENQTAVPVTVVVELSEPSPQATVWQIALTHLMLHPAVNISGMD